MKLHLSSRIIVKDEGVHDEESPLKPLRMREGFDQWFERARLRLREGLKSREMLIKCNVWMAYRYEVGLRVVEPQVVREET